MRLPQILTLAIRKILIHRRFTLEEWTPTLSARFKRNRVALARHVAHGFQSRILIPGRVNTGGDMLPPSKQFAVVQQAIGAEDPAVIGRSAADVLARVAHEMLQPLAAATSALQLLTECPDDLVRRRAQIVLERQFQRLSRFVDDLLEASRLRSAATILHIDRIDVCGLVGELVEAVGPQAAAKRQRIETRLPPGAVWIDADAMRLQEVVSNLLVNAVSYTGEGGLVLVSVARGSGEVLLAIRDTGRGIPADQLPHLFEMFSNGHGAPDHVGLGLAIAKDLVELHGGSIRAASRGPGRGSKFVVRLPETAHRSHDGVALRSPEGKPI